MKHGYMVIKHTKKIWQVIFTLIIADWRDCIYKQEWVHTKMGSTVVTTVWVQIQNFYLTMLCLVEIIIGKWIVLICLWCNFQKSCCSILVVLVLNCCLVGSILFYSVDMVHVARLILTIFFSLTLRLLVFIFQLVYYYLFSLIQHFGWIVWLPLEVVWLGFCFYFLWSFKPCRQVYILRFLGLSDDKYPS